METHIYETHNQNVSSNYLSPSRVSPSQKQTKIEEISRLTYFRSYRYIVEMSLFFVVLADPLPSTSQINLSEVNDINKTTTIQKKDLNTLHLKEMIWNTENEFFSSYNHKKFNDLILWKVSDLREETDKWESLKTLAKSYTETDIKNFGCTKLLSTDNILKIFRDVPNDYIHIIVEPKFSCFPTKIFLNFSSFSQKFFPKPATTGKCLPMVYLSNKKFALSHILYFFYLIRKKKIGFG
jgi:hypothetical protein